MYEVTRIRIYKTVEKNGRFESYGKPIETIDFHFVVSNLEFCRLQYIELFSNGSPVIVDFDYKTKIETK